MQTTELEKQVAEINRKLDFITEQMREQQRKQREFEELKHDLMGVGKDAFQAAVTELEEVAPYFDTDDLLHLVKKLLRNTRNLTTMLEQVESTADFFRDAREPLKSAFTQILQTLDVMDRKGYFEFMKEAGKILDEIVTTFSVEDVRLLRENITHILMTVKNLTQPQMLTTMNNAVGFYQKMDIEVDHEISLRELLRSLKDPEVKRGLAFMMEFVKNMAKPNGKAAAQQELSTN